MIRRLGLLAPMVLAGGWLSVVAQVSFATLPTGASPYAVALNTSTNKTYVANITCDADNLPCPGTGSITVVDGATNLTQTVNVGVYPYAVAVNPVTNKIYVVNTCGNDVNCAGAGTVTAIDGATNNTMSINVGAYPYAVAVNSITNKIYVVNNCGDDVRCFSYGTVTVIDGATLNTTPVSVGAFPVDVEINSSTNKIFVVNNCGGDLLCSNAGTVTVIDGSNLHTLTLNVGFYPYFAAINQVTNKIYVANNCGDNYACSSAGTVTAINGDNYSFVEVGVGFGPYGLSINPIRNKIYIGNQCGNDVTCSSPGTVTVLDGGTNGTTSVEVGAVPSLLAVDSTANKVYVTNVCGSDPRCHGAGTVTVINGNDNSTFPVAVGDAPQSLALNTSTHTLYVPNFLDATLSVIGANTELQMVPVTPCRLVDTREGNPIVGGTTQSFVPSQLGGCNIPLTATAYSLNVTVVPHGRLGYLTIWPTPERRPTVSTLNSPDGRVKANAAIVPAGVSGAVSIYVTDTSDVILDIDGYFAPAGPQTYQFYPLAPCRVIDTRGPTGDLGGPFLHGGRNDGSHRDFPVREGTTCIPADANVAAYSLNFTAAPHVHGQRLGYLTVWPEGSDQPFVSTLNNPTGTVVANAAIVPAGTNGGISVFAYDDTDMIADINGYFGPAGQGGYSFYPAAPCRAYDSRNNNGQPFRGTRLVNISGSPCSPPATARGYVFNATVVPDHGHPMGYLTLWPDGQNMPFVSTLNAYDGLVTSNMAIVPNNNGSIDAYADGLTHLILDISGYFAP